MLTFQVRVFLCARVTAFYQTVVLEFLLVLHWFFRSGTFGAKGAHVGAT